MSLNPDAKKLLAETIRGTTQAPEKGLRARLLVAIHDEADRRYRLSVPIAEAGLDETHRSRRKRIEDWLDERTRATKPKNKAEQRATRDRLLTQAETESAATLINRLVLLRHLEALGLSKPVVVTGGWKSAGYRDFREFAPGLTGDDTEGYSTLLQYLFEELAVDLPGLFGDVGLTRLFPVPAATLREVIERIDEPGLASVWADDTTLGWVYQFWNDFERDALDAKALDGGKIEPHEIASKTQMFTDRYIAEWLLQNSLGLTWLAMCQKHGWKADAERVLPVLEARRAAWRTKRDAGEVALDALMPIEGELEGAWKYYVPQPIPQDAVEKSPTSVAAIKLLDPACGSGHFLVIAFGLLASLYREEARHLQKSITDREIAESIVENNLHGIDIDPRAIQIAAAAVFLKAKSFAKDARPKKVNLVAPVLQLGKLPGDDPAIVALRRDLKHDVGIPEELTTKLLTALAGVDYLGSLLKVDSAVDEAIRSVELQFERVHGQGDFFSGFPAQQVKLTVGEAKATVLDRLEQFLAKHSKSEDLGLRLDGEELAAGIRFVRMTKPGTYDLVVGNPPYQGLSKTASFEYVTTTYPRGKADLCTAFLERGLELARPGGLAAMVAMRGWLFLTQFSELRHHLLHAFDLRTIGDLDRGAFESMPTSQLISVSMTVFRNAPGSSMKARAIQPTAPGEKFWGPDRTDLKRAAVLVQRGTFEFDPRGFSVIDGEPILYWWGSDFLVEYGNAQKLGDAAPVRQGMATTDNSRFVRRPWEVRKETMLTRRYGEHDQESWGRSVGEWVPYIKGAAGACWIESLDDVVLWRQNGLEVKLYNDLRYGSFSRNIKNADYYFRRGVAFSMIGNTFQARVHRFASIIGHMGSSAFAADVAPVLCLMNSAKARFVLDSLNPGVHYEVGDVNRLPVARIDSAQKILSTLEDAFGVGEAGREPSVEFCRPGSSPWRYAQDWAQLAVDRPESATLAEYVPRTVGPEPADHVSFAIGVALGRFGVNGEGILDRAPPTALPIGILFVGPEGAGSLQHPACALLHDAWKKHGAAVGDGDDLPTYLRKSFFDFHKKLYEKRPIYLPLSSAKKSFVAYVSIHRWASDTLTVLLADHLVPTRRRLEGELDDLRTAKAFGGNKAKAEKRFGEVQKLLEELNDFIAKVSEIADKGPPPVDDKTTKREVDARFEMDLDDGVMVNSAALWPLLESQWKDPKKWWKELANAQGKKNYDWSHLAGRYFPKRVRSACVADPSLAVAHKCFWELHPAKAYAWELRLQDEIRADFTIDEPGSKEARIRFLQDQPKVAEQILADEKRRRERKASKKEADEPLFEGAGGDGDDASEADDD
jgi:hypothetical protein